MRLTDTELLDRLRIYHSENGRSPKRENFPRSRVYHNRFGSWNKALQLAGLPLNVEYKKPKTYISCTNCGDTTTNPKFCSTSCAATYNNQRFPKRKPRQCKNCGGTPTPKGRYCQTCNPMFVDWSTLTLGELKTKSPNYNSMGSTIRVQARNLYNSSGRPKACSVCGYDTHYQVAHIKPVASFSDDTPISAINSLDNLVALCPTHHWEYDNGHLRLPDHITIISAGDTGRINLQV